MKILKLITATMLMFMGVSCSHMQSAIESGTGFRYSASDLDSLRGQNKNRGIEGMGFSQDILNKSGKGEYKEYSPPVKYNGGITGYSPGAWTTYTGAALIYEYNYLGTHWTFVVREIRWKDGTGCWQGTNPPPGWYNISRNFLKITVVGPHDKEK